MLPVTSIRNSWHLFLRLFVPLAVLLVAGSVLYGRVEITHELARTSSQEAANVRLGAGVLTSNIEFITRDLRFLASDHAMRKCIAQPSPENLMNLAENFMAFSGAKQIYDQIRWIDETGMEIVRVDNLRGKPSLITADKLQNKAQRYYFADTLKLGPGEVFISPLDLNIEQNSIELPHKPMLRFATPVADQQGRKRGIVILNYYGRELLQAFERATADHADRSMLVNAEGYWLRSPQPKQAWGFMFKRTELTMAARAPAAWQQIRASDQGQVMLADGMWTWDTVYPLIAVRKSSSGTAESRGGGTSEVNDRQYFWKSISHYSADKLAVAEHDIGFKVAGITALLLGLSALASWKLSRAWSQLATAELNYQTVADFTNDWETWVDPSGHYRYCSPSCERLTGHAPQAFMSDPGLLLKITHPDDQVWMAQHLQADINPVEACEFCFRIILPDGQVRWLEHACLPVFDEAGEFLGRRASNRDVTERKNAEAQIQQLAYFDTLTGLPNRRMLHDRLEQALAQAKRFQRSLAIMFLDLDGFKQINDTLGHDVGDELLKVLAIRLSASARVGDTISRQGGDEFIIVLTEISQPEDAAQVASKVIQVINEPVSIENQELHVTTSVGIAVFPVNGDADAKELMKKADQAMYAAKAAGGNGYRFFTC